MSKSLPAANLLQRIASFRWVDSRTVMVVALLFLGSNIVVESVPKVTVDLYPGQEASLSGACIWDCRWYASIVTEGYHMEPSRNDKSDAANWAFFPAFPLVASGVRLLLHVSPESALVITSKAFLLLSLFAFIRIIEQEVEPNSALLAGFVLAFNPYIIYAHVGYSEPMYFFLSTIAFIALNRKNWLTSGIFGGILSATRFVGAGFALSYLTMFPKILLKQDRSWPRYLLGLLFCPLGLALFVTYLYYLVGDALAFSHIQVAWNRTITNPISYLEMGLRAGGWERYFAITAVFSLMMSAWLAFCRRFQYAIFLAIVTLLPLSTGLEALPRAIWWQMPLLLGIVELLSRNKLVCTVYLITSIGWAIFVTVSWFKGASFVT
jgi:hypothetical protein